MKKNSKEISSSASTQFWQETNSHIKSLESTIELKNKIIEALENKIDSLKTEIYNNPPSKSFHDLLRSKIRNTGIVSVGKNTFLF
jgi:SMC interacting uncharacterized protein involved in chromosome segregation